MGDLKVYKIGENITCPLGYDAATVFEAVQRGESKAKLHATTFGLPEPFFGSVLDRQELHERFSQIPQNGIRYTTFEQLSILSAYDALQNAGLEGNRPDLFFVLSSTKGNIDLLENPDGFGKKRVEMGVSAQLIGRYFNNPNPVIVVSNACTSGVVAQIHAKNILERNEKYKYAVVVGADLLNKFVVSGFQSFKALSQERCKPFDVNRCGLNLGEGAATVILQKSKESITGKLQIAGCGNRNDANHISGPSRTGEGLYNSIQVALSESDANLQEISFINAHGTATLYNDDMESWAISRSGLEATPVNSLKAIFGHTLGAAGLIECIISGNALQSGIILPSTGFESDGTIKKITINPKLQHKNGKYFLKIISGFGGSNAAILFAQ